MTQEKSRYILQQDTVFTFQVAIKSQIYSFYTYITHALLLKLNPTADSQLLDKTVHCCTPTGREETPFLPGHEFLCIFNPFYNSLPICLSSNQTPHCSCSVLWLPPRPCAIFPGKYQCSSASKPSPSFLASLQRLSSTSFLWSPKPSLLPAPKLNPSSHSTTHEPPPKRLRARAAQCPFCCSALQVRSISPLAPTATAPPPGTPPLH